MAFTHLQVRSGYSLMNSTVKFDQLIKRAKEWNMRAIALTDEGVMHGAVSFYRQCLKNEIKPIIGMVLAVEETDNESIKCIALAKNNDGYHQLLKLSTYMQTEGNGKIQKQELFKRLDGLIIILLLEHSPIEKACQEADEKGLVSYLTPWREATRGSSFYLGIKRSEQHVLPFLKRHKLEMVGIGDVRYLNEADQGAYQCLRAIDKKEKWQANTKIKASNYFFDQAEAEAAFSDWPELIEQANRISDACHVTLVLDQPTLPKFPIAENKTASAYLQELCQVALVEKYPNAKAKVKQRLDYELSIIESMQFSDYFLIVWDFVRYAKQQGILVGPGRGSASGSIVAFLLDITVVDPIQYDLLFERFLNPERVSMPDIDIDFSDHRRDEVIAYVRDKYGSEHVAQIGTFGTFQTRSVLRELAKVLDITPEDMAFILKELPAQAARSIVESLKESTSLLEYVKQSPNLQQLFKIARILEGIPRNMSTHAAGVVISEQKLTESVALSGSKEAYLTQFAMADVEAVGLLKIDFLGLRNLTTIERILHAIKRDTKQTVSLASLPLDDRKSFDLLKQGKTNGIFQLESQGMRRVLTELKPSTFEDIVAVNALYRPGPRDFIETYVKRKHKQEAVSYVHEDLAPILSSTYGVLVYQEQIIQIANRLAGFTLGQADLLRRAVSKKKAAEIETLRDKFIQGCRENGYQPDVAEELFSWITRFADYGFNRSHAVAYSLITYQLSYLKAHYPSYFLTELLNVVVGQKEKMQAYVKEAKDSGTELLQPSINRSFGGFVVEKTQIRMGLWSIKGIGQPVVKEIIHARKQGRFKDLFDFCLRVPLTIVNRSIMEALILAGAFDETNIDRASLLATLDQAIEQGELFGEFDDQESLFGKDIHLDGDYQQVEPFTNMQQLAYEKELIGMYVSDHPLANMRTDLRANGYVAINKLQQMVGRNKLKVVAVVQEIKVIRTKRGDQMAFLTLGDEESELDGVIFPDLFRKVKTWLAEEALIHVVGKVEERQNKMQLVINELAPFDRQHVSQNDQKQRLFIRIGESLSKQEIMEKVSKIADQFPGDTPIIIYQTEKTQSYQLASQYNLQITSDCLKQLYHIFQRENVVVKKV